MSHRRCREATARRSVRRTAESSSSRRTLRTAKRVPHPRYRNLHLPLDPTRIRSIPPRVPPAIDLHDQTRRRSQEVHDEAPEHDLAAKLHAEPAPAQTPPQGGLARGACHMRGARSASNSQRFASFGEGSRCRRKT